MATLLLIRHAEPTLRGVFLGRLDPSLSQDGEGQAEQAMGGLRVGTVFTSPLRRAWQTARYAACLKPIAMPDLQEVDMGEWTGKSWQEIETGWKEQARRKAADWLATPAPGGEPWAEVMERAARAWARIREAPAPVAIVAHQGINAALACLIAGLDPLRFQQHHAEVTPIEYADHF